MQKPDKPSPDFPLFAHATGYWAKKIRGKFHYFGPWDDPEGTLASYQQWGPDLQSGQINRMPKDNGNGEKPSRQGRRGRQKSPLPRAGFPLFAHSNGQWAKKIRGRLHYFEPWENPQAAFELYRQQREDLFAGRPPMPKGEGLTIGVLVNLFLTAKKRKMEAGEMRPQTWHDCKAVCDMVREHFGPDTLVPGLQGGLLTVKAP